MGPLSRPSHRPSRCRRNRVEVETPEAARSFRRIDRALPTVYTVPGLFLAMPASLSTIFVVGDCGPFGVDEMAVLWREDVRAAGSVARGMRALVLHAAARHNSASPARSTSTWSHCIKKGFTANPTTRRAAARIMPQGSIKRSDPLTIKPSHPPPPSPSPSPSPLPSPPSPSSAHAAQAHTPR